MNRRFFVMGSASLALAGCTARPPAADLHATAFAPIADPYYVSMYSALPEEKFPIPAVDVGTIDKQYLRQQVPYETDERPGTIIIDSGTRFLYRVEGDGMATRYGVGVGRAGFGWSGRATILHKAEWPRWTPTKNMIARDPDLAQYAGGMEPGLDNPLGARALYLFQGGQDTLYRIHGTNEPWSIGHAMSSGCIRLFNHDIIDLHERTPLGSQVVVLEHREAPPAIA